jgi:hypothetical protein
MIFHNSSKDLCLGSSPIPPLGALTRIKMFCS